MKKFILTICILAMGLMVQNLSVHAQPSNFTYQGSLKDGSAPANGTYDFQIFIYDALTGGTQQGQTDATVQVVNGIFTIEFTNASPIFFSGAPRFLEIRVKPTSGTTFTTLNPRSAVTSVPWANKADYARIAFSADVATNAGQLGGVAAGQYVVTTDPRMTDARTPTAGSANYIQNATAVQSGNFNVAGSGSANIFNAGSQFNIGGLRVFTVAGIQNVFAGVSSGSNNTGGENTFVGFTAGQSNSSGFRNTFIGANAGKVNTTGIQNTFVGGTSGVSNTTGGSNSFFGVTAGNFNSTGNNNSFFGTGAGSSNSGGNDNSFFGYNAGFVNQTGLRNVYIGVSAGEAGTSGVDNTFVGMSSGIANTIGLNNTFMGKSAGFLNTTGFSNTFIGRAAGNSVTTGGNNTTLGSQANVFPGNLTNATAIGADSLAEASNSVVLGNNANVGIGTSSPAYKLHVVGQDLRLESNVQPRFSLNFTSGTTDAKKWYNRAATNEQVFALLNDAETAETPWLRVTRSAMTVSQVSMLGNLAIGGSGSPDQLAVFGTASIGTLGAAGSTALCRNATNQISTCSSSIRYKNNVQDFRPGLNLVRKLRPVTFNWKADNKEDMGLVAEEVNAAEPLLTITNKDGQVEGVKYDRVGVVLVNAVNEQQDQIEAQQKQIDEQKLVIQKQEEKLDKQQSEIDALKLVVCSQNATAAICKPKN
jgi:Chaperone of endosialidase